MMNLDSIRTPCAILYPWNWPDTRIRESVKRLERAGFEVSFEIGGVDEPCVDCEDSHAFAIATSQEAADLARPDPYDPV